MTNDERATGTDAVVAAEPVTAADERTLPATRTDARLVAAEQQPGSQWRQPVSVAYLPLALAAFIVLAFAMAMWTFLAATG